MQRKKIYWKIWFTLADPRVRTMIAMMVYAAAFAYGLALVSGTPRVDEIIAAAFILPGAGCAALAAWAGRHWLERIGAAAAIGGLLVEAVAVVMWMVLASDDRLAALALLLALALALTYRLETIKGAAYALGRGPISAAEQARIEADIARAQYETSRARDE